jgi:hypothetical protein
MRVLLGALCLFFGGTIYLNGQEWVELWQKGENFYEIQKSFNEYWKNRDIVRGQGYKQFKRWEWFMETRVDAEGNLPRSTALYRAWLKERPRLQSAKRNNPIEWSALGPTAWNSTSYNPGLGRVNVNHSQRLNCL